MGQFRQEQGATTKVCEYTPRRSDAVIVKIGHIPSGSACFPQLLRYASLAYHKDTPVSAGLALAKNRQERV